MVSSKEKGEFTMTNPKKTRKIISASTGKEVNANEIKRARVVNGATATGNASGLRIGAIVLWVLAIAFEVLAILSLKKIIKIGSLSPMVLTIIALVLDLACVIAGSQMWKKANHIKPASSKNKVKFWLWNNLGVVVAVIAFVPMIILTLADKKADKKTKTIVSIVAVVALVIGGLLSYDFDPASEATLEGNVFWAPTGSVYHTNDLCHTLDRSVELTTGTVDEAIEAGRQKLCYYCAKAQDIEGIETAAEEIVLTDEDVVYWGEGNDLYHLSSECSLLDACDSLLEGNETQAKEAGKTGLCLDCVSPAEEAAAADLTKTVDE